MIPPRMTRTVTAAARVRWRNAASPNRKRPRTLARSTCSATEMVPPCNTTSTTGRLPAGCIRLSLSLKRVQGSYSSGPLAALQATLRAAVDKERAPNLVIGSAPFPVVLGSEHGLAGRVLDLNLPVLLNIRGHIGRHRHIIELRRHLGAVLVRPSEELQRFAGSGRIGGLLVDEDPSRRRHRPRLVTGLIGEDYAEARLRFPVGVGRRSLERFRGRGHSLARLVDHLGEGQLVLQRVSIFDVT